MAYVRSNLNNTSLLIVALVVALSATTGCQQKMADQPSYKPLQPCDFFPDGRSERPIVPFTVARGHLRTDLAFFTGRIAGAKVEAATATGNDVAPLLLHPLRCSPHQFSP